MQVSVRPMIEKDVKRVAEIEANCFSTPWTEEMLTDSIRYPQFTGVILEAEDKIIGYAFGSALFETADLNRIAVVLEYRSQGYGGWVLEEWITACAQKGAEKIFLEVRVSNFRAIALYKSKGFQHVRLRKNYYENGEDAIEMRKELQKL